MVIDTSALVAIAQNEPEAAEFEKLVAADPVRLIASATLLEAAIVLEAGLGEAGGAYLDLWIAKAGVEILPVEAEHADQARRAWRRYGKGRHPAGLTYGDCFSYSLAKLADEPLLFKGNDFSQTDIRAAAGP